MASGIRPNLLWRIDVRDESSGKRADSPHQFRGRETMRSATKRILIAGAGLTAAALFGSLPYHGSSQAQGLPSEHHDVALVDATVATLLLSDEGATSQAAILADCTSLPVAPASAT
jgi:hypothetical protein